MKPSPFSTLAQCMANTPDDHPEAQEIHEKAARYLASEPEQKIEIGSRVRVHDDVRRLGGLTATVTREGHTGFDWFITLDSNGSEWAANSDEMELLPPEAEQTVPTKVEFSIAKSPAVKTSSLTPEQKRVKIAEACGWKFVRRPTTGIGGYWELGVRGEPGYRRGDWGSQELGVGLPDYLNDLNAMHEAEKCLSRVAYWNYADLYLKQVVWKDGAPGTAYQCATAAQRAEAFLLTIEATNSVSTGS